MSHTHTKTFKKNFYICKDLPLQNTAKSREQKIDTRQLDTKKIRNHIDSIAWHE